MQQLLTKILANVSVSVSLSRLGNQVTRTGGLHNIPGTKWSQHDVTDGDRMVHPMLSTRSTVGYCLPCKLNGVSKHSSAPYTACITANNWYLERYVAESSYGPKQVFPIDAVARLHEDSTSNMLQSRVTVYQTSIPKPLLNRHF